MCNPKVSVVVPIFNVERYLRKCIDSILSQSLKDIEVILVDDGSPDHCGEIIDEYAQKDNRVKAVHQKNAGLGPARNTGIANAKGEYIGFVDSDDWVDSVMFERLYTVAAQYEADIAVGGHRDMANGKIRIAKPHPLAGQVLVGENQIMPVRNRLFGHLPGDSDVEAFPMRVWTSIYRNAFLKKSALQFQDILSEDTVFNLSAYRSARIIAFTGDTDYCYRVDNQPSIMRTFSPEKLNQYEFFIQKMEQLAEQEPFQHNDCVKRVKRMAIDYCRLYAGLVCSSNLSISDKLRNLRKLAQSDMCMKVSAGYPINTLPGQQRIFHKALSHGRVREVLVLMYIRQALKKKVWK